MKIIMLIVIGFSSFSYATFYRNVAGVVVDEKTTLQWQDDTQVANTVDNYTWQRAMNQCKILNYGGHSDWRLPNINELSSITDYYHSTPSINATFQNTLTEDYWTSTGNKSNQREAWYINFSEGFSNTHTKTSLKYVRCVRN